MEPRIQYAQTKDGVSVAFSAMEEGMPFVEVPSIPGNHVQLVWQNPNARRWYERVAEKRMLVRYDSRGTGLSQRDAIDFSLESLLLDLQAVVDRLGLQTFVLWAGGHVGPVAIAYATRYPKRVSHLVLWHTWARWRDAWLPEFRGREAARHKLGGLYPDGGPSGLGVVGG